MNLRNLIDKRNEYADYIIREITYIIKNFGKRDPGAQGETDAANFFSDYLKNECGCEEVFTEEFEIHPGSFFGWIYITVTCAFIAMITSFFAPAIGAVAGVIGLLVAVIQFGFYTKIVDWMFKKKISRNVTAIKHCTGEVKRRIFFNGHMDACWEWPVNYHCGGAVCEAHMASSLLGLVFYTVLCIIAAAKHFVFAEATAHDPLKICILCGLIFIPLWILMYFMWNERRVVDGANDNLTGCYMGVAILKAMHDEGISFENTEVGVILNGAEEAGIRGSYAWCKAHKGEYEDVPTFIYSYDTIHDPKYLMANYRDLNGTVKSDKDATDLFYESAQEIGVQCVKGWVPPFGGATDNAAYNKAGFRSAGITGLNHKLENYYHTRRDTYDNLNAKGIADCFAASVKVLENFDNGAKQ
ncbi:MAG: M28 family peptidase [Clostridia bacterium]|nr:M28 family peptidase [Clostridia bacterium]